MSVAPSTAASQRRPIVSIAPAALDIDGAAAFVGLSTRSVARLTQAGTFPKPRQLSGRRVAYLVRELQDWIEARPVSDIAPPEGCGVGRAGNQAIE